MFPVSLQFHFSEPVSEAEVREAFERRWFPRLRWGRLDDLMACSDEWPEAVVVACGEDPADRGNPAAGQLAPGAFRATVSLPVFPRRQRGRDAEMRATKLALLRMLSVHFESRVACDAVGYRRPRERAAPDPDESLLCVGGRLFWGWTHCRDLFHGELHPPGRWTPIDDLPEIALLPDGRIEREAEVVAEIEAWRLSREIPLRVPGQEYDEDGFLYDEYGEDEAFDEETDGIPGAGYGPDLEDLGLSRPGSPDLANPFDGPGSAHSAGATPGRDAADDLDELGEYFARLDAWLHDDVGTTASKQLISSEISLPPPESLSDEALYEKLWEVIHGLAETNTYLHDTNHLSDRELYTWLWEEGLNEKTVDLSGLSGCACHTSPIGGGSESDILVSLTYYDDAEARAQWKAEFPDETIPAHRDPPADRDRLLPDPE